MFPLASAGVREARDDIRFSTSSYKVHYPMPRGYFFKVQIKCRREDYAWILKKLSIPASDHFELWSYALILGSELEKLWT